MAGTALTCCIRRLARVGGLEVGFVPAEGGLTTRGILEGAQARRYRGCSITSVAMKLMPNEFGKAFVIYQGHHGDYGAHRADVILPGAAYTEKTRCTSTPKAVLKLRAKPSSR
jgi:NADH-quinone oxidoreductase subunit G